MQIHSLTSRSNARDSFAAAIWDVDDVLVDTRNAFRESQVLALHTLTLSPPNVDAALGIWDRLLWYFDQDNVAGILQAIIVELRLDVSFVNDAIVQAVRVYDEAWEQRVRPITQVVELVRVLNNEHIPQGIVTNGDRSYQLHKLAITGILELIPEDLIFVAVPGSEEAKPHPNGILSICRSFGIAPEHVVYVGDRLSDIVAANLAGCGSIQFVSDPPGPDYKIPPTPLLLRIEQPALVAQSVSDLARFLGVKYK